VTRTGGAEGRQGSAKLGLSLRPLAAAEKRAAGVDGGLIVEEVDGAAAAADVRPGDIILGANGQRVSSVADLEAQLDKSKRSVALLVNRAGSTIFIPVRIGGG
jgi:serine protease Do